jgi:hypothetical protein
MLVAESRESQRWWLAEERGAMGQEERCIDCVPGPEPWAATKCRGPIRQAACTSPSVDAASGPPAIAAAAAVFPLLEEEEEEEEEEARRGAGAS